MNADNNHSPQGMEDAPLTTTGTLERRSFVKNNKGCMPPLKYSNGCQSILSSVPLTLTRKIWRESSEDSVFGPQLTSLLGMYWSGEGGGNWSLSLYERLPMLLNGLDDWSIFILSMMMMLMLDFLSISM